MNELIELIFKDFTVDKETIPVSFLFYEGHGEIFKYQFYQLIHQVDLRLPFSAL